MPSERLVSRRAVLRGALGSAAALAGAVSIAGCSGLRRGSASGAAGPAGAATGATAGATTEAAAGAAGGAAGGGPGGRPDGGVRLGLDTYSLHRTLTASDERLRKDLGWVLDRLDELGLEGIQIDPSHFPGTGDDAISRLQERILGRDRFVEFGMGGWDVPRLAERVRLTARFGGRAVRTFCGDSGTSREEARRLIDVAAPALRHAAGAAEAYGVDLAVENHGDFTSGELVELIERVGHPRLGACLDTGNSLFVREDPLECARRLAPHVKSMHLKDWRVAYEPDGSMRWTEAVPGEGQVPVLEILRVVLARQPSLNIVLETPVRPSASEEETVEREWVHVKASAAAARALLARV